jgi:hypothetical protein
MVVRELKDNSVDPQGTLPQVFCLCKISAQYEKGSTITSSRVYHTEEFIRIISGREELPLKSFKYQLLVGSFATLLTFHRVQGAFKWCRNPQS